MTGCCSLASLNTYSLLKNPHARRREPGLTTSLGGSLAARMDVNTRAFHFCCVSDNFPLPRIFGIRSCSEIVYRFV